VLSLPPKSLSSGLHNVKLNLAFFNPPYSAFQEPNGPMNKRFSDISPTTALAVGLSADCSRGVRTRLFPRLPSSFHPSELVNIGDATYSLSRASLVRAIGPLYVPYVSDQLRTSGTSGKSPLLNEVSAELLDFPHFVILIIVGQLIEYELADIGIIHTTARRSVLHMR
jgi:hypothetical protein